MHGSSVAVGRGVDCRGGLQLAAVQCRQVLRGAAEWAEGRLETDVHCQPSKGRERYRCMHG
jgi:hypothetical protein